MIDEFRRHREYRGPFLDWIEALPATGDRTIVAATAGRYCGTVYRWRPWSAGWRVCRGRDHAYGNLPCPHRSGTRGRRR